MNTSENGQPGSPGRARLGLWDAVSIIIGIIIGATIYETPPLIFRQVGDPWITLGLWALGGILVFVGALCYAELATTYPRSGGDYNYLTRAFGPLVGYLFGWAQLAVVQTGSIGLMAYIFAYYAVKFVELTQVWPFTGLDLMGVHFSPAVVYATGAVVFLTLLNAVGVVLGKVAQNLLTFAKIVGLGGIIAAGFIFGGKPEGAFRGQVKSASKDELVITSPDGEHAFKVPPKITINIDDSDTHKDEEIGTQRRNTADRLKPGQEVRVIVQRDAPGTATLIRTLSTAPAPFGSLAFAMVLIFLAYGGYNDAAFVAAEVRDRRRNLPRALFIGTLAVMVIYLLVNGAYLWGLGPDGAAEADTPATDTLRLFPGALGTYAEQIMSVLVMVSALGAVNGLIFTSSRIYATLGADYSLFTPLSRWSRGGGSPISSLVLSMIISLAMIWLVGTAEGKYIINEGLAYLGMRQVGEADWGRGGFEPLLKCTAPIFWVFFLLTGLSLFVLRINDRNIPRGFSAPLFPLTPLIFCAMCGFMLYSGIGYAGQLGIVGGALVVLGVPFYIFSRRRDALQIKDLSESDRQ